MQSLMNGMRQANAECWVIVGDSCTLDDDRLEAVYDNTNEGSDYFRDRGSMVLAAEGSKAKDSNAE